MNKIVLGCLGALVLFAIIIVLSVVGGYNHLTSLSQGVDSQWAQVENVYQRRADLIPNLVSTVQGAANFEKSTLEEVTKARAAAENTGISPNVAPTDPAKLQQFQQAQDQLHTAVIRVLAVAESYPQLRATENFSELQAQLEGTENRIAVERQKFNAAVQAYDTTIRSFPDVLFAGMMGFQSKPYFTATAGSETPPAVHFDNSPAPAAPATGAPTNP
ncbi:MAG TPA: LemA family protein [Tepidisphaeraceae bacterium]|jgi:LemA protein|nr:LemA family protein [Tepidisphaeraceae bacterium]